VVPSAAVVPPVVAAGASDESLAESLSLPQAASNPIVATLNSANGVRAFMGVSPCWWV
jgi:hypothetical protein